MYRAAGNFFKNLDESTAPNDSINDRRVGSFFKPFDAGKINAS